jgi:radical SAM protein with 4Fe4S-binding SPASM domain
MTINLADRKLVHPSPALFSFITLREEIFGAILFNPFIPAEIELDEIEAFCAGKCNGTRSPEEILRECQIVWGLSREEASRKWDETIEKLDRVHALQYVEKNNAPPSPALNPTSVSSTAALSAPKTVIWEVTYACNLRCPHCLTSSGSKNTNELDTQDAFRLIDRLAAAKVLYLSLTGGEPFLRPDLIPILSHIADTGMRVDLASNGYHIPSKVMRSLRDLPVFQIQISIDGIGEEHDRFRGKPGAFQRACTLLRRLKEEGLSTSISTTATARNIDQLPALIDLAMDLGCDSFKAIPFIPAGRGKRNENELRLDRQGSLKLSRILAQKSRELAGRINVSTESTFLFLLEPAAHSESSDGAMICSAGYDELTIGADGTAYPCPFLHAFPLGNLLVDPMDKIWHRSAVLDELRTLNKNAMSGPCRTCEYAPDYCRGGCRASAYLDSGSLKGSDPLCFKPLMT